jgi:hypothetical protein
VDDQTVDVPKPDSRVPHSQVGNPTQHLGHGLIAGVAPRRQFGYPGDGGPSPDHALATLR